LLHPHTVPRLKNGDKHIVDLLTVADVYAIPQLNPDGFAYVRASEEALFLLCVCVCACVAPSHPTWQTWTSSANRYWRKTRRPNPGSTCVGTDPNRNFPPRWDGNDGSSGDPCAETFRGSSPLSEKETLVMYYLSLSLSLSRGRGIALTAVAGPVEPLLHTGHSSGSVV
jgi:hypothetical protein